MNEALYDECCEFFGSSILMFILGILFRNNIELPEELKQKVLEYMNGNIKEDELKPLIEDYYDKIKKEFYENT